MTTTPTVGSLFSGIGGFDLGFERAGFAVKWQVEIEEFPRRVLAKHWPDVRRHDDVRTFPPQAIDPEEWRADCIIGGFPCQDVSVAGRRAGIGSETRSGLWSEFRRVVALLRPRFVVVENTPGLLAPFRDQGRFVAPAAVGRVLGELSEIGFDAEWAVVPASDFGAAHLRERVFIVAYPAGYGGGQRVFPARQGPEGEGAPDAEGTGSGPPADARSVGGRSRRARRANPLREVRKDARSADAVADGITGHQGSAEGSDESGERRASGEPDRRGSPFVGSGWWSAEPDVVRMVHGLPRRLVRPAIAGLGNAVVPQVAEWVGRQLMRFILLGGN